jgi:hypothetical protein
MTCLEKLVTPDLHSTTAPNRIAMASDIDVKSFVTSSRVESLASRVLSATMQQCNCTALYDGQAT